MNPDLIKTIQEVQQNVPVAMTSTFATISPFLRSAESQFLTKLIGKGQITALKAAYDYVAPEGGGGEAPNQKLLTAVKYCQKVIANLGYHLAIPIISVTLSGAGIQITSSDNTKNAFQWQVEDIHEALIDLGFNGIEELLEYLESDPDVFTAYHASDQYKEQQALLIRSAADFSWHYDIEGSRYIYQNILSILRRVEAQTMTRVFGDEFYESLKVADLSVEKKLLVDKYIKPGLALLTAAKAIVERVITLKGGKAVFNFRGNYNNMKESMAATSEQIKTTTQQLEKDGNDFIAAGLQLIADKPTGYEDFVPPVVKRRFKFNNDPAKGLFGV